jgi:hypothetical protein
MNDHDLSEMHESIFVMIENLYNDDRHSELNQMIAHALIETVMIIEAELSLREAMSNA